MKGTQFVDLKDAGDPVENAKVYDEQGADEIAFLDITASYEERDILIDIVRGQRRKSLFPSLSVGASDAWRISGDFLMPERIIYRSIRLQ